MSWPKWYWQKWVKLRSTQDEFVVGVGAVGQLKEIGLQNGVEQ